MDLYETSSDRDRDLIEELVTTTRHYEGAVKYFVAMALVVVAGFGLRIVFENQLGQIFGAMLIWFSILFGIAGVVFATYFVLRGKIADYRGP